MSELIDFKKYKGTTIRLSKVTDTKFDGKHPNDINVGYVKEGIIHLDKSNEHQCFLIIEGDRFFNTSQVLKIEEQEGYDLAHTVNSIYKVEPMFTAIPGEQEKHSVKLDDSE
jgi:hypothetical protein